MLNGLALRKGFEAAPKVRKNQDKCSVEGYQVHRLTAANRSCLPVKYSATASVEYVGLDLSTGVCFRSMDSLSPKQSDFSSIARVAGSDEAAGQQSASGGIIVLSGPRPSANSVERLYGNRVEHDERLR